MDTYIYREREREERNESSTTLRRCIDTSTKVSNGCLVGRFLLARPIGRVSRATFIETHRLIMTAGWRRKWSSRHCTLKNRAQSSSAPRLGHVRLPSAVLGRSTHHNFSPYSGAYKYVYVHLLNNNVNKWRTGKREILFWNHRVRGKIICVYTREISRKRTRKFISWKFCSFFPLLSIKGKQKY